MVYKDWLESLQIVCIIECIYNTKKSSYKVLNMSIASLEKLAH